MPKIIKNSTASGIPILSLGVEFAASLSVEVDPEDYLLLATDDTIAELTPLINSGDLVINDGIQDLSPEDGINFLKYSDESTNIRFLSNPDRVNDFESKTAQKAIEEARQEGIQFSGIDAGDYLTSRIFTGANSTGGQVVTTTASTIPIDTQSTSSDAGAFLLSSGELQVLFEDDYLITYSVTLDSSNGTRTNSRHFLELNRGTGFLELPETSVYTYERNNTQGRQTGTGVTSVLIRVGDILRLRSEVISGSNNVVVTGACKLQIQPFTPSTCEPNLTIDGKDLTDPTILGRINAGEL